MNRGKVFFPLLYTQGKSLKRFIKLTNIPLKICHFCRRKKTLQENLFTFSTLRLAEERYKVFGSSDLKKYFQELYSINAWNNNFNYKRIAVTYTLNNVMLFFQPYVCPSVRPSISRMSLPNKQKIALTGKANTTKRSSLEMGYCGGREGDPTVQPYEHSL